VLPKGDRPYRHAEQVLFDWLPVLRKADRLRIFLTGEALTSGFVRSDKFLAWPDMTFRYRQRVRRFDLAGYRVMPKRPAAAPGAGPA